MAAESNTQNASALPGQSPEHPSTTESLRQLSEAGTRLFEAGQEITENLTEISQRVDHATNVGSQILKSPWLIAGGAVLAGALILMVTRRS